MTESADARLSRLAKIAQLYHIEGMNQGEIAERYGIARPMISRLLKEAEECGIVQIRVDYPYRAGGIERAFRERWGLADPRIHIIDESDREKAKSLIGLAAAKYVSAQAARAKRIGVSWGSTLFEMISHLPIAEDVGLEIVQLIGATGRENNPNDGPLIAAGLADKLKAKQYLLHAPLIVESALVRDALMKDKVVRETLDRACGADIAFVGIGSLVPEKNSLFRAGYISGGELERIRGMGAVGDICAQFYDEEGKFLDIDINRRVIGLPLAELRKIPKVIGVTLGEEKAASILGALRGKRITGLITDLSTAERVLELDAEDR